LNGTFGAWLRPQPRRQLDPGETMAQTKYDREDYQTFDQTLPFGDKLGHLAKTHKGKGTEDGSVQRAKATKQDHQQRFRTAMPGE
jgi:hypothetical protein